jgi:PA domain
MGAKIILVERNDCTFTQKSINVQKEGGKLAVVIDNSVEDPGQVIMMDDGKGAQVSIPTVLIGEEDGLALLEFFKQGGVVMSVTFQVPVRSVADLQLWLDITDHKNFIFLRKLQPFYEKIRTHGITYLI